MTRSQELVPVSASAPRSPWWLAALTALAGLILGGAGVWAAVTVFAPPPDVVDETAFTFVEVVPGEVGASINLNTVAEWASVPVGTNLAPGTVTSVLVGAGQEVGAGTALYSVNLRPVVVAQGEVPAFRPLSRGAEGADVAQLQAMLAVLGFYPYEVDGVFDWVTQQGVRSWQESLGVEADGVVQAGDVLFIPSLPTRVSLDTELVHRGAGLGGGEPVVLGLPPSPQFLVPVTEGQAAMMPEGTRVEITGPDNEAWTGFVTERRVHEQSATVELVLSGEDGAVICGDACGGIPVTSQTLLRSRVIVVETVTGAVVPGAALLSKADGAIVVIDEAGAELPVRVLATARGMSVIEGAPVGTRVRVPVSGS